MQFYFTHFYRFGYLAVCILDMQRPDIYLKYLSNETLFIEKENQQLSSLWALHGLVGRPDEKYNLCLQSTRSRN
jgi:hypothetical protein